MTIAFLLEMHQDLMIATLRGDQVGDDFSNVLEALREFGKLITDAAPVGVNIHHEHHKETP